MTKRILATGVLLALTSACSVKKLAINKLGDALASGGSTYESDNDPDLVGAALPFSLKLIESLLAESPKHPGLLMVASSGFTEYAYAFVEEPADEIRSESLDRSDALHERARKLYLRAHEYGMRGLDSRYPGFRAAVDANAATALARVRKQDIPLLYWTAASLGLAISSSLDNAEMISRLPLVDALIGRVAALDETWNDGAVPEFLISLEASHSGVKQAELEKRMRAHFQRSLELSKGKHAAAYVSLAESVCVPAQNAGEFKEMLAKALAVDVDKDPPNRLSNLIAQRRARWLQSRVHELFLESTPQSH